MHKATTRALIFIAFCIWSTYEALCALWQVAGLGISGNARFAMTGNFPNPGPFGGFLAISMGVTGSYIIKYRKRYKGLYRKVMLATASIAFCLSFIVLPATLSRTAWFALGIALISSVFQEKGARQWIGSHRRVAVFAAFVAILLCTGAFFLKKDSAIGRLHIWRIECLAILEHPQGTGKGTVLGTYGKVQERFFRDNIDKVQAKVIEVAGCPEYAFNEYLHVGIEYGIAGMLLFIAIVASAIVILIRHGSIWSGGLVAWAVFAFGSYPFSVPRIDILLGILLAEAAICCSLPGSIRYALAAACVACGILLCNEADKTPEFRSIYEKGYGEFLSGEYEESIRTLSEGAGISSDPLFHVIMGRDHEALGQVRDAEEEYFIARYMIPCRIYPLVRLARLYIRTGRDEEALECAVQASRMPVNEKHLSMVRLGDEIKATRDSLIFVLQK